MFDLLKEYKLPASVIAFACVGFVSAYTWMHSEFVNAADFQQYQTSVEKRILTEKKQQLETEQLRLTVKKEAYPAKFDAVDKALLDKYNKDITRIESDIKAIDKASKR